MTGTLFVNSPEDLDAIISLGFKTQPLLNIDKAKYDNIINNENEFKIYYEGLLSFYRIPSDFKSMPKKNFEFIPIQSDDVGLMTGLQQRKHDAYYITTRNQGIDEKVIWILKFLDSHKNQKTLIYSQFLDLSIEPLIKELNKKNIKFGFISGKLSQIEKLNVVKEYNENKINLLIFTLSIKEGISFKETNNIIVIQPYWNYAIIEQVLARGIRLNSHSQGNKSTINLHFLIAVDTINKSVKQWINRANKIMNSDIKKLEFPIKSNDNNDKIKVLNEIDSNYGSRDIDLCNRMFIKQESINIFEKKILALKRFEDVNNNENNAFIKSFKNKLLETEKIRGRLPTNREIVILKRYMYDTYYKSELDKINKRLIRFNKDVRYKPNRNPDLEENVNLRTYTDIQKQLKVLIEKNASLDDMFNAFKIDKKEITQFQANFTPINEITQIIDQSGIKNDDRNDIRILEPTAGIGGVVGELLQLKNKENFFIDAVEIHGVFYQIGNSIYDNVDNVKFYNANFLNYCSKYNYDYILGNPPFNIRTQIKVKQEFKPEKGQPTPEPIFKKVDAQFFDIHFVAMSFNMLSQNGCLTMIISDRFQRDKTGVFTMFNIYLDDMKKKDDTSVIISKVGQFKSDKGVVKNQETSFGMVCITLKKTDKLSNFNIDLNNGKRVLKTYEELDNDKTKNKELTDKLNKELKPIGKTRKINLTLENKKIEKLFVKESKQKEKTNKKTITKTKKKTNPKTEWINPIL